MNVGEGVKDLCSLLHQNTEPCACSSNYLQCSCSVLVIGHFTLSAHGLLQAYLTTLFGSTVYTFFSICYRSDISEENRVFTEFSKYGMVKGFKFFDKDRRMALIQMSSVSEAIEALIVSKRL